MALFNFNKRRAGRLHEQAQQLSDEGQDDEAIALYLKAIELDPEKVESYYNLGLIYKYRNNWQASFKYNATAYALDPEDEAARWNLAIAATALRDWATARKVWEENGVTLEAGDGPINDDFGITPVRLNPDGNGEVVWARRIDPVRAKILNVPLPTSGYFPGDIVLHDGAAVGHRMHDNVEKPVFNVLELFEPSAFNTFKLTVLAHDQGEIEELEDILQDCGMIAEDWTTNYRVLCRACSEGRPHEEHDTDNESVWITEHEIGVGAASEASLRNAIEPWADTKGVQITGIECVLERPQDKE